MLPRVGRIKPSVLVASERASERRDSIVNFDPGFDLG
jgi:hypothetical protein